MASDSERGKLLHLTTQASPWNHNLNNLWPFVTVHHTHWK